MPRHKSRAWLALYVTLLKSCDGQHGTFSGAMMQVPHTSSLANAGVAFMVQHVSGYEVAWRAHTRGLPA